MMETIQIVLDQQLLKATDLAARRAKQNRSALVRDALREHLNRLKIKEFEERDSAGYAKMPDTGEGATWEAVSEWPAD